MSQNLVHTYWADAVSTTARRYKSVQSMEQMGKWKDKTQFQISRRAVITNREAQLKVLSQQRSAGNLTVKYTVLTILYGKLQ